MRGWGVMGVSLVLVACTQGCSTTGMSDLAPLLVPMSGSTATTVAGTSPAFRPVPAEAIEPLAILTLPSVERPLDRPMGEVTTGEATGPTPTTRRLPLVRFPYASWALTPEAKDNLHHAGEWLRGFMPRAVAVSGHADTRGTQAYNQALGLRRAQAVVTYLRRLGIQERLMRALTFGELQPMCADETEACYAANRRAVVVVEQHDGSALLSGLSAFPPTPSGGKTEGSR